MGGFDEAYKSIFITNPAKLSLKNTNFCITQEGQEITLPLRDILMIVCESNQVSITASLLSKLADCRIAFFTCDDSHMPNGVFTPYLGHYKISETLQTQMKLSKQKKAILWQQIIKQKLYNQSTLAKDFSPQTADKILKLSKNVMLNDSKNFEAQGAIFYFQVLFGVDFVRKSLDPINSALNYGYAILRGSMARSLVGSGFLPALGLFHRNQFNSFNLADDMMEPYRIFVDSLVLLMVQRDSLKDGFQIHHRQKLAGILGAKILCKDKYYPMYRAITRTVWSLANILKGTEDSLLLPIFQRENSNGREIYESFSDV
ncbi:type II CRISPR-associated endonuclease Cas1 [Helicobacter cappadocius]|uniref:CRISPR-associated endonuclease Cas1 n=1 Tax=Helicobacter cappadocius TaxID=3063998 RepID=A0AA90T4I5_9HELI|nr:MULTISPECIES: type II CRISPR-associated endonuclease Cas1 [unclassified Helicobacter]MDO7252476.1 type II CRISPR-associated endonuclease Cas1 [Helicobacter sp. faydin-H75]MDP2538343.1 type II CRISPR-associated endonuclease Cas1 [Helicobacter sp. faydin-H76]